MNLLLEIVCGHVKAKLFDNGYGTVVDFVWTKDDCDTYSFTDTRTWPVWDKAVADIAKLVRGYEIAGPNSFVEYAPTRPTYKKF